MDKHEVVLRMRAIELLAYWEGRLITNRLMSWFGISRQQASSDIKRYNNYYNPRSLVHDPSVKAYVPIEGFQPVLTTAHINEYLNLISGIVSETHAIVAVPEKNLFAVQLPDRGVHPEILREVLRSCRVGTSLYINYASMNNPVWHERIISPHSLVYTGFRWHVRAYCHKNNQFRDFILSRIEGVPSLANVETVGSEHDIAWNEEISLHLLPNPHLNDAQKILVEKDFGMSDGVLKITVRKALAHYSLQRFQAAIYEEDIQDKFRYPLVLQRRDMNKVNSELFGAK